MGWWLLLEDGQEFLLPEGTSTIGRSTDCSVLLPEEDLSVSRRHARLVVDNDQLTVEDLGSSNGSWVNEQAAVGAVRLRPGDTLRLGDALLSVNCERPPKRVPNVLPGPRPHFLLLFTGVLVTAVGIAAALRLGEAGSQPRVRQETSADLAQPAGIQIAHSTPERARASKVSPASTLFAKHCSGCHGLRGEGGTGPRLAHTSHPHEVDEIRETILQGVAPRMPAFNGRLSKEEVKAVAIYTRGLMGKGTPHTH